MSKIVKYRKGFSALPTYDEYSKALLHFDESPTKDEYSNTWLTYGSPIISSDYAKLNKSIKLDNGYIYTQDFTLGGQDFTIDFWAHGSGSNVFQPIFGMYSSNNKILLGYNDFTGIATLVVDETTQLINNNKINKGDWNHFAFIYSHSRNALKFCINGDYSSEPPWYIEIPRTAFSWIAIGFDSQDGSQMPGAHPDSFFLGEIDEFHISDGIARWNYDFIPPLYTPAPNDIKFYDVPATPPCVVLN